MASNLNSPQWQSKNKKNFETKIEEDSVYLYSPEHKDLYNDVLESFNKSDCVFNRNLLAYLEEESYQADHGIRETKLDQSFYSKHLISCKSCQAKASEYRKMKYSIKTSLPEFSFNEELSGMLESEIKDAFDHFAKLHDSGDQSVSRLDFFALFRSSIIEFIKGFFSSREIVLGFLLSSVIVLLILIF